jgi:hypothetical protein
MRDGVVWFGCPAKILYTTTHYPTLVTSDLIMEAVCSYQMLAHKYYMVQPKYHVMIYIQITTKPKILQKARCFVEKKHKYFFL